MSQRSSLYVRVFIGLFPSHPFPAGSLLTRQKRDNRRPREWNGLWETWKTLVCLEGEPSIGDTHASSIKRHFRLTLSFPLSPPYFRLSRACHRETRYRRKHGGTSSFAYPPRYSPSSTPNDVILCNAKMANDTCYPYSLIESTAYEITGKSIFLYCDLHTENLETSVTFRSHILKVRFARWSDFLYISAYTREINRWPKHLYTRDIQILGRNFHALMNYENTFLKD